MWSIERSSDNRRVPRPYAAVTVGKGSGYARLRPSSRGRTNILTKEAYLSFFYAIPDPMVVVELGLSKASGRNDFSQD